MHRASASLTALMLACLNVLFSGTPAAAQEAAQWMVEKGNARRASTLEFEHDEKLSYGFSCWRQRWIFFFNYQAPEGGACADHDDCETNVADVNLVFKVKGLDDFTEKFTLFENYYFQAEDLSVGDIEAMLKAGTFTLALDDKLKEIWDRDKIEFSLKGFAETVKANSRAFACPITAPVPVPLARPDAKALASAALATAAQKTAKPAKKNSKAELKEKRVRLKALKKSKKPKPAADKKKKRR